MVTGQLRGHKIEVLNNQWAFSDTKELVAETHENRDCGHCKLPATVEGHDGCLGTLNGIMNCCCGHGRTREAYVQFLDSSVIRGQDAVTVLGILKKQRSGEHE